jgi:intracellular sulfur oxidation DsrE/DsrF family protein
MSTSSKLIRAVIASVLLLSFAGATITAAAADKAGKQGVVIQVSENNPAIWNLALNNAKNIQQELGKDNVNIEIVAYGPGIEMLAFDSEVALRLKQASADDVALLACGNTMRNRKLTEKDLDSHIRVVATGVVEIMNRQRDGWSYIKP